MPLGCLMVDVAGKSLLPEDRDILLHPLVGGVILFTRNFSDEAQLCALLGEIHALRSPRLLIAVDHEGGRVQRFRNDFTRIPSMRQIGHAYDLNHLAGRELARQAGWVIGSELKSAGIDLAFSPVVDLDLGVSEVIGDRSFHKNPDVVATLAGALAAGMREAGMCATAKHFPGHGAVALDSHVALPVDRRIYADLVGDLTPYRRLMMNGLESVMMAHVVFPEIDHLPASLSRRWVHNILRGDMNFQGAVFTDDLSMAGAAAFGDIVTRAQLSLEAGCDMLPVCNARASVIQLLDSLNPAARPVSALRIARMHGRAHAFGTEVGVTLRANATWQAARVALDQCRDGRPVLTLEGDAS